MTEDSPSLSGILDRPSRHLFFTGKGGVGKTSLACAIAIMLSDQGKKVLLVSTDPASNLDEMLETTIGTSATPVPDAANLFAMNIDPEAAAESYRQRVLDQLASDTSEAERAYHRQMVRDFDPKAPGRVVTPLMRLQDSDYTRVVLVTLPETTPVSEASALQDDLRRAKIEPHAWVINRTLASSGTKDPVLLARIPMERGQTERVRQGLAKRVFELPWQSVAPVGIEALSRLVARDRHGAKDRMSRSP